MMTNPQRGEVPLRAEGETHVLRLSLGALACLEAEIAPEGLLDLAERIEGGGLKMRDVISILTAGFAGGGAPRDREAVADMAIDGGATEATRVALMLISAAFGVDDR